MSSANPVNKIKTATAVSITVGLILFAVSVVAQPETSALFKHFTTRNGMLSNSVYSFKPDKNGLYWVASGIGLQRFDGYSFENWNQPENPADARLFGAFDPAAPSLSRDSPGQPPQKTNRREPTWASQRCSFRR